MPLRKSPARNLINGLIFIGLVIPLGVIGYMARGWSFGDAFYMVIITIFSVGFREVHPIDTPELRAVTIGIIFLGCTGMIFLTGALVQFFTLSQIQQFFGLKRMKTEIDHLRDHIVICGFGRIGTMVAREVAAAKSKFVVIDSNDQRVQEGRRLGYLCIEGEATDEEILKSAGIERAAALATVLPDDAANVFITLSARNLNRGLRIIARGEQPTTESKLLRAGADRVVLPAHIGAERIAEIILYPDATHLMRGSQEQRALEGSLLGLGLELELVTAAEGAAFTHRNVGEVEKLAEGSFLIVAIRRRDGTMLVRPAPDIRVEPGDGVVILGRSGKLSELERFRRE
jgi:trk system potassium uptake protein TrkA/voltage-gated potassium channel